MTVLTTNCCFLSRLFFLLKFNIFSTILLFNNEWQDSMNWFLLQSLIYQIPIIILIVFISFFCCSIFLIIKCRLHNTVSPLFIPAGIHLHNSVVLPMHRHIHFLSFFQSLFLLLYSLLSPLICCMPLSHDSFVILAIILCNFVLHALLHIRVAKRWITDSFVSFCCECFILPVIEINPFLSRPPSLSKSKFLFFALKWCVYKPYLHWISCWTHNTPDQSSFSNLIFSSLVCFVL